ncbi:MAG: hypothetical protein LC748_01830, partial [Thermomicrobia bacterium]|nr:hypothetical protein [Thermomicrobia bacterium]
VPPSPVVNVAETDAPPAGPAIPIRPVFVPSDPAPDPPPPLYPESDDFTESPMTHPPATPDGIATETVSPATPEPRAVTLRADEEEGSLTARTVVPPGSPLLAHTGGASAHEDAAPVSRRSRAALGMFIGALLAALIVMVVVSASRLSGGGGLATATAPGAVGDGLSASAAAPSAAAPSAAAALPTVTAIAIVAPLLPTATPAPTVAPTVAVVATIAAPQPTTAPSPTAVPTAVPPTAIPPTATPAPSLGVFGVGTTDRGDLTTLSPADAVNTFAAGQEVFAFINYDGARPGGDTFNLTLIADGNAQPPQNVTLQKSGGFVFVSLGTPAAGNYRIEVRHDGALLPNQPTFQVNAPAPTPVPAAPRTAPVTSGPAPVATSRPVQQPVQQPPVTQPQPKAPTCVPGTC